MYIWSPKSSYSPDAVNIFGEGVTGSTDLCPVSLQQKTNLSSGGGEGIKVHIFSMTESVVSSSNTHLSTQQTF